MSHSALELADALRNIRAPEDLVVVRDRVRTVDPSLALDVNRVVDLACEIEQVQCRALDLARDRGRALDAARDRAFALPDTRDLARDLTLTLTRVCALVDQDRNIDTARAHDIARHIADARGMILALARRVADARDIADTDALARDIDRVHALPGHLALARDLALDLALDLARADVRDVDLRCALADARTLALINADALDCAVFNASAFADAVEGALALDRALADTNRLADVLTGEFDSAVRTCQEKAEQLTHRLERASATGESTSQPPGRVVTAVTAIACQILPAAHRARYTEEFRSDLFELPRRSRLAYALRVLKTAPATRLNLSDKLRTPAPQHEVQP
jgi:hypothetical protein